MKSQPVILLVESDEMFQYMQPMLQSLFDSPQLVHCSSYRDAMHFVESNVYADFIFADWSLTGYQFMSAVRSDLENHNTPVVIMSEDRTNKKIALNSMVSEATFFLAKPFLEKGLVKKFGKAMKVIERRRKQRLHSPTTLVLPLVFNGHLRQSLPLIDISIDGCLFRAPLDLCQQVTIYQPVQISLKIDEIDIQAEAEIYRIGQDRPVPANKDSVLLMLRFTGGGQQERDVQDLIDELGRRW